MTFQPNTTIKGIADAGITASQVIRTVGNGHVTVPTTALRIMPFSGIALSSGNIGNTIHLQASGHINPKIISLGTGIACAVGINASGFPVRATDSTCVSPPNWIGHCDTDGNITIAPRRSDNINIIDFGAIEGDSSTLARQQNDAAIIAASRAVVRSTYPYQHESGIIIWFPTGDWYISKTIDITRPVKLMGAGSRYVPAARIFVPDTFVGIKIWQGSGQTGFPDDNLASAQGAIIEGLMFQAEGNSSLSAHGCSLGTPTGIINCQFSGFGGHGIYIASENSGFPDNWKIEWTRCFGCQDGIHIRGGDTNNGCCYSGDFQGNRGWGVYDRSFLGCNWVSIHTAENGLGGYYVNTVGESSLINCYAEADQPPNYIANGNVFVINGLLANGFTQDSSYFGGGTYARMHPAFFYGKPNINFSLSGVTAWSTNTGIAINKTIRPTIINDFIYQATNNGTTGTIEPIWPTVAGNTVNDNGIIWQNVGVEPRITSYSSLTPDQLSFTIQITQAGYPAGQDSFYPTSSVHSQILNIRYTTDSGAHYINFTPTRADYPQNFGLSQHQLGHSETNTTIAASSNGILMTPSTINVTSTTGFKTSGIILVQSSTGLQSVNYTGITSTSFTGCTCTVISGVTCSGTLSTGGNVYQGGSGTFIFFTPYFYYTDNVWTGITYGGLASQFFAGSNNGTYSAFGWGHEAGTSQLDSRADGGQWSVTYNLTSGRWQQLWANSVSAKEYAGSRSFPFPGAEVQISGIWGGNDLVGFRRIGWYDASQSYGSLSWLAGTNAGTEWYSTGDILINRSGTTNYPVAVRAKQKGGWSLAAGYGFNKNWASNLSIRVGDTVYASTDNGFIFRASAVGTTGTTEPSWPLVIGNTVADGSITWENVGTHDGFGSNANTFEPVIVASHNILIKDCSVGGTITLSFSEISHDRYKLTGSPGTSFSVIIGVGAADSWNRVIYNVSGQTATIKATSNDTGVAIPNNNAYHIFSDGINAVRVT